MPIVNPFGKKSGKFSGKGVPAPDFAPFCRLSFCRLFDAGALPALRRNGLAVEKAEEDLAHLFESLRVAEVKFEYVAAVSGHVQPEEVPFDLAGKERSGEKVKHPTSWTSFTGGEA